MKIGVVDNGATKSEWVVWDKATGAPKCFFFSGIQPRNMNEKQLFNHFEPIAREISYACDTLYYFSTGLFAEEVRTKVANVLGHFFEHVQIGTDLEGTGRAILGGENGAVAILGTGSNVGTYVNHQIIDQPLSLGYLLGDEGSGADLGKRFLKHYLESGFEKPVDYAINDLFQGTKTDLINHLNQNADSKWLASFVPVLSQYRGFRLSATLLRNPFKVFMNIWFLA